MGRRFVSFDARKGIRLWFRQFFLYVSSNCMPFVNVPAYRCCMFTQVTIGRSYFIPYNKGLLRRVRAGLKNVNRIVEHRHGVLGEVLRWGNYYRLRCVDNLTCTSTIVITIRTFIRRYTTGLRTASNITSG